MKLKLLKTYQTAETTQQENHKNVIPNGVASSVSGNITLEVRWVTTSTEQGHAT